jgi:hypothetical protein
MQKYLVIVIQAHDAETPEGRLMNVCTLQLMESDPEVAIKRAKKLVQRKFYRVAEIIENYVKS